MLLLFVVVVVVVVVVNGNIPFICNESFLFVFVYRIDPESKVYCFKPRTPADRQKIVNNCIKICIDSDAEFSADVLKDALSKLLEDSVVVNFFMRTIILSYNAHPELKKFVLSEVLPTLVRKRVWVASKSVWEGVPIAMKALATSRDAEPSLRAMLCLPGPQLQTLLKFKEIKAPLVKVLKALSESERVEVLSGGWVGVESNPINSHDQSSSSSSSSNSSNSSTSNTETNTKGSEDKLKMKLIDELLLSA